MMGTKSLTVTILLAALVGAASSCSRAKKTPPPRETVLSLLQQEAQTLKAQGEEVNPSLGVKITWNLEAVEVREQAGNENQPWAGAIRFKILTRMREPDGSTTAQRFEKDFQYVYDVGLSRWIVR